MENCMPLLDLNPDQLLSTTRAVRKRLDLTRPVESEIIRECVELAVQAPSGSNMQMWHFIIVTDVEKRKALGDLYRQGWAAYSADSAQSQRRAMQHPEVARVRERVASSAQYLAEHIHEVPVLIVPCIRGRFNTQPGETQASAWGSILPAVWSFMLAA